MVWVRSGKHIMNSRVESYVMGIQGSFKRRWEGGGRRGSEGQAGAWEELTGCGGSETADVSTSAASLRAGLCAAADTRTRAPDCCATRCPLV